MKKILSIAILSLTFFGCQSDVSFNEQFFQGQKDGSLWRSGGTTATVNSAGNFSITGTFDQEKLVLTTANANVGTYVLGTSDARNKAVYFAAGGSMFDTSAIAGAPNKIVLSAVGSGYLTANSASTTAVSGSGIGLKVDTTVDGSGGIATVRISVPGNGYVAGDVISVNKGLMTGNANFVIQNVANSNGEIKITEYANGMISGDFKLNAVNPLSPLLAPELVNFQYGKFYKIPVTKIP
jgi:hypothetical protein